jgi:hydrogenase nickel incorporation protein HypA/HybF
MHELAVTQAVIDAVVEKTGDTPIAKLTLEIGCMSGVLVEAVRFCFEVAADGTPLAGAVLDVVEIPGTARGRDCALVFDVADPWILLCSGCGSANATVLTGADLLIRSVEVKDECARPAGAPTTPASG